jgi:hypothetical protein
MKPVETLFWLGTAGILCMAANKIVKNVTRDIIKDIERKEHRKRCVYW